MGEREIGSQLRPTHTNFTLFVLLLRAVAWHVAANARLHKYEYISLSPLGGTRRLQQQKTVLSYFYPLALVMDGGLARF